MFKIYQLNFPPNVLNFLWRASTNSLPTRINLSTKHVPIAATCPFCFAAPETILHVLVQCSFARSCWSKVPITGVVPDAMLFSSWLEAGLVSWNSAEVLEAGMVCWSIWNRRNELVWNFKHPDAKYFFYTIECDDCALVDRNSKNSSLVRTTLYRTQMIGFKCA
ncbi:hypothetical protein F8388_001229 [Cannabis sativa]|uniref:Reverse transcriptase zinc-binding domain-containing protein n=1 Tax=Cannabis sativa TaxID=3483 RepID=A0A7J6GGN9_CANSA|nr:hypothetical protein F8388_001229 [Cannabis sativa]